MALGISNGSNGGDFLPIVKWDARAGRFFRVDRSQSAEGWVSNDVDLTMDKPKFAVDFGSIETGYIAFTPTGPDFHMAPLGTAMPAKPTKDHKAGFRVKLAGNALKGSAEKGVREFAASAKSVLVAMDNLHSAFEAAPEAAAGKVPVVELSGSTTIVTNGPSGKVTSYSPTFTIVAWTDRLPEFGDRTVAPPSSLSPPPPRAAHVPPPAQPAAPPPAARPLEDEMPF